MKMKSVSFIACLVEVTGTVTTTIRITQENQNKPGKEGAPFEHKYF